MSTAPGPLNVSHLDEVLALGGERVMQPAVAVEPCRVIAVDQFTTVGVQEPQQRGKRRPDPLGHDLGRDRLSLLGSELVDPCLQRIGRTVDGRRQCQRLGLRSREVVSGLGRGGDVVDEDQFQRRESTGTRDPDGVDPHRGGGRNRQLVDALCLVLGVTHQSLGRREAGPDVADSDHVGSLNRQVDGLSGTDGQGAGGRNRRGGLGRGGACHQQQHGGRTERARDGPRSEVS